uniref:palmitoyl-CoA hydrolase n=1 Tax=Strigamia maritima TaxID=126957 RepID=T1J4Z0_STRMM
MDFSHTKTHPGTNVQIIKVLYRGRSLIPMWDQVETYAEVFRSFVNQNPEGITLIGYSQGGLIARAIVESTPNHTVHTLIIIASPQMGMYGIPDEVYESYSFMKRFVTSIELLGRFAYSTIGQLISIGGYWKDPNYLDDYKTKSKFLPVLNNEISHSKEKVSLSFCRENEDLI